MKIDLRWLLPIALGLSLGIPSTTLAQGRGNANGHERGNVRNPARVVVDRDDRRGNDRRRDDAIVLRDRTRTIVLDRDDVVRYGVRGRGPAFCRSGAGHPVWGLEWCLDRGYAVGRPGSWFLRGDDLFLLDQGRVLVVRNRGYDADAAFWGAVVSQILNWAD